MLRVAFTSFRKISIQGYNNIKILEKGSFVTCFTAVNSESEKVVLIVSDNIQELQTRFDLAGKLEGIEGVQKLHGLQKLEIQDSTLEQLEAEYPSIFSKDSHVLTGRYYATQYNDHVRQLSLPQKLDFFRELLVLVKQVHDKGVYHMDLKPSNIMVQDGKPVLIDFGQSVTEAEVDSVLNTSAYAPKHDVYSCNVIPEKFDIYCLGNMLHEIYTGQPLGYPMTPSSKQKMIQSTGILTMDLVGLMTSRIQDFRLDLQYSIDHPLFVSDLKDLDSCEQLINQFSHKILNYSYYLETVEDEIENSSSSFYSECETLCKTNTNTSLKDLFGNVVLSRIGSCLLFVSDSSE
ncbi:Kinase [Hexamita inflata]|uniref:CAMK CAMKL n=1 Tax=Hexamita inflata TaxID=28002 RepID=A0AA86U323_9EUKA|nr:CAMK CAMKL [Hexamita inflata]